MSTLKDAIKQKKPFESIQQECYLNLVRTVSLLEAPVLSLMRANRTTPTQYNVLRILAGAGEDGLTCGEIKERMITRLPDLTRLIDRLLKEGLVERHRSSDDRRVVLVGITDSGRAVSENLKPKLSALNRKLMDHMTDDEVTQLNALITKLRDGEET